MPDNTSPPFSGKRCVEPFHVTISLLFESSINNYHKIKGREKSMAKFCHERGSPFVSETSKPNFSVKGEIP